MARNTNMARIFEASLLAKELLAGLNEVQAAENEENALLSEAFV